MHRNRTFYVDLNLKMLHVSYSYNLYRSGKKLNDAFIYYFQDDKKKQISRIIDMRKVSLVKT